MSQFDETCDEDRIVDAVKEFTRRLDQGESIAVDAFLKEYGELAPELRPAIEGLMMVRGAEPGSLLQPSGQESEFAGKPIGDFQIIEEIGRGGMGIVYEAVQLSLGRKVALKVLPFASALDEVRLQRFRNEAHAAAALHHTNIVPVYAVGSDRGVHYYAMQLVEGQTLVEVIDHLRKEQTGRAPSREAGGHPASSRTLSNKTTFASQSNRKQNHRSAVRMILEAALAIDHAHAYGVIHRDIKPGNLMRDQAGKIWVTDFGLAQIENEASQLTRTGDPLGTLRYMSPEQAAGNRTALDHRTDIYSLGVTLYELLVLQPAFSGDNYRKLLNQVVEVDPPAPITVDPGLPIELDTIVRKAMAKLPGDRYASAKAFADDLQRWLNDEPIAARPPNLLERLSKWRRRNSGLVAAAGAVLLVATISLAVTTIVIWRQQEVTRQALDAERNQRQLAEENFTQARNAVDTFSELSERELAFRPDLQDLRRLFLETSLDFYQDFLAQRAGDEETSDQLQEAASRVERMVSELKVLENVQPLLQLADSRVREELSLTPDAADELVAAIEQFRQLRESMANPSVGGLVSDNEAMSELVSEFDSVVKGQLQPSQIERLLQISRQRRLPFTFKSREIVEALQLTQSQQLEIARIIEETRPDRGRPSHGRPPRPFDFGAGGPFGPPGPRRFPPGEFGPGPGGPGGPGPSGPGAGVPGPGGPRRDDPAGDFQRGRWMSFGPPPGTERTVAEILKILTEGQRAKWDELIGDPFLAE